MVNPDPNPREDSIDVAAVVRASVAISQENVLERLLEKVIHITLANSGAEKGIFLLPEDDKGADPKKGESPSRTSELIVAARGDTEHITLVPDGDGRLEGCRDASLAVIRYVARTGDTVVLHDAAKEGLFTNDEYISSHNCRSVLCHPHLHRGELSGILYLENNLLSGTFHAGRLEILKMLSSQIAVSLENARLHAQREQYLRTLEKNVEQLNKEIAEREQAEELARQQQEKLIQADKMASVGILVSGVAHEINNPNNFMLLNANNIADVWNELRPFLDKYSETNGDFIIAGIPYSELRDELADMIRGISEGSERIKKIVQTLKDFARVDPGNLDQNVDINAVIDASTTILANLIKKSSDRFSTDCQAGLPPVKGNFQQLEQVVINLISNSCQALEDRKGVVSISTVFEKDSNSVVVTVKDEGSGITPENMKHIMDPFFTTKRDSGGTGLGLSISYKIVADHKGELIFESDPGKGTTASITLPALG